MSSIFDIDCNDSSSLQMPEEEDMVTISRCRCTPRSCSDPTHTLPAEIMLKILSVLNAEELGMVGSASRSLYDICNDHLLWFRFAMEKYGALCGSTVLLGSFQGDPYRQAKRMFGYLHSLRDRRAPREQIQISRNFDLLRVGINTGDDNLVSYFVKEVLQDRVIMLRYISLASRHGDLRMLQNLLSISKQQDFEWKFWERHDPCAQAAANGHVDCLRALRSGVPPCPWRASAVEAAVSHNQLNALVYLLDNGCFHPARENLARCAAEMGNIEILTYFHRVSPPVVSCIFPTAVMAGKLNVLQWASQSLSVGLRWRLFKWSRFDEAILIGRLDIVKFLWENDCDWNDILPLHAVQLDRLEILEWMCSMCSNRQRIKIVWKDLSEAAAAAGNLRMLKFCFQRSGGDWDERVLRSASLNGHLECVQYAVQNGCFCRNLDSLAAEVERRDNRMGRYLRSTISDVRKARENCKNMDFATVNDLLVNVSYNDENDENINASQSPCQSPKTSPHRGGSSPSTSPKNLFSELNDLSFPCSACGSGRGRGIGSRGRGVSRRGRWFGGGMGKRRVVYA